MVHDLADRFEVVFDDERAVANAGLVLPVTLGRRLGLEALVDQAVDLGARPGAARPGRKVLWLVHAMLLGADCIDDCDVLRSGRTAAVLGHRAMAPSTLGAFLRAFSFGHVRQLDRVLDVALGRAWDAGAGPGSGRVVIDLDSFIGEVHGEAKQGAEYGYTRRLGYHPLLATRAESNEVLHVRLRRGNSQRGAPHFVDELLARVRRAGASGEILLRADSGFSNKQITARLAREAVPLLDQHPRPAIHRPMHQTDPARKRHPPARHTPATRQHRTHRAHRRDHAPKPATDRPSTATEPNARSPAHSNGGSRLRARHLTTDGRLRLGRRG